MVKNEEDKMSISWDEIPFNNLEIFKTHKLRSIFIHRFSPDKNGKMTDYRSFLITRRKEMSNGQTHVDFLSWKYDNERPRPYYLEF